MDNTNQDGLRIIAAPTDRRAYDTWAYDDEFCHQFLLHVSETHQDHQGRAAKWDRAIKRYWRDRCSRRELADELQIGIDAAKSLITLIRKAAEKFQSEGHAGFKSTVTSTACWDGRVHATITANDIDRISEGDHEAVIRAEEYHRLSVRNQLTLFDPKISKRLADLADESDAVGITGAAGHLITEANRLKASVAKDDPFVGRPMFQDFRIPQPNYREDLRGRPTKKKTTAPLTPPASVPYLLVPGVKNNFNDNTEAA